MGRSTILAGIAAIIFLLAALNVALLGSIQLIPLGLFFLALSIAF